MVSNDVVLILRMDLDDRAQQVVGIVGRQEDGEFLLEQDMSSRPKPLSRYFYTFVGMTAGEWGHVPKDEERVVAFGTREDILGGVEKIFRRIPRDVF